MQLKIRSRMSVGYMSNGGTADPPYLCNIYATVIALEVDLLQRLRMHGPMRMHGDAAALLTLRRCC
jgi:hypothetical protein